MRYLRKRDLKQASSASASVDLYDYYTERQAQQILGLRHREQIVRKRRVLPTIRVGGRILYHRDSVDRHAFQVTRVPNNIDQRIKLELDIAYAERHHLDTNEWLTRKEVMERWKYTAAYLYKAADRNGGLIRTRLVFGQIFFYRRDIERFMEM